jgi:hypothetical protein
MCEAYFISWLNLSRFPWRAARPQPPLFLGKKNKKKEKRRKACQKGPDRFSPPWM